MILKFNNGRGALLCEHCSVIVMENMRDYEWQALTNMYESGYEWFCKTCAPDRQKSQALNFLDAVGKIADLYTKKDVKPEDMEFYTDW